MRMLSKRGVLSALLLAALLVGSVSAWTVLTGGVGAGAKYTIKKAEATVGNAGWITIGNVGSGYAFSGSGAGSVTVTNAKELVVTFSVTNYEQAEWQAIASGTLTIVEPGVAVLGTIDLTSLSTVQVTLADGSHTIRYDVAGVAGYPSADQYVEFLVEVDVATP